MQPTETTVPKQLVPWKPGQSGNPKGRPKGSRHKLSEAFVSDLYQLWQEGGVELIRAAAIKSPVEMVKVVASLVPKDFNLKHDVGPSFRGLWEAIAQGKLPPPPKDEEE